LPAGPEFVIKEKAKAKAKERADDGLGVDSILTCLGQWAQEKKENESLVVAVVGLTNVGFSFVYYHEQSDSILVS
jgi:nuclear GTP-binding protein